MKKLFLSAFFMLYITCVNQISAFAGDDGVPGIKDDAPDVFVVSGMQFEQDIAPFHRLQNMMRFEFINGEEVHERFEITYDEKDTHGYGPSIHIVDFYLTYDSKAISRNEQYLITGTFEYYHKFGDDVKEYNGNVFGMPVDFVEYDDISYDKTKEAIMLRLDVLNGNWDWDIYLYADGYKDMKQYPGPLPLSKKQTDVAAGAAVSVIGIALLNIMTKTSLTGFVSMNTPSTHLPESTVKKTAGKPGGFFSRLIISVRDMLVDEGRSYISGKIKETLDDTGK